MDLSLRKSGFDEMYPWHIVKQKRQQNAFFVLFHYTGDLVRLERESFPRGRKTAENLAPEGQALLLSFFHCIKLEERRLNCAVK
jgi:hypothetical protein